MLPNLLSLLRVLILPPLLLCFARGWQTAAVACLFAAALSDLADGYLARRLGQSSRLGRILDPLADKIFILTVLAALVYWRDFPVWLLAALALRDLVILLAGLVLLRARDLVVPANRFGKYTTAAMGFAMLAFVVEAPPELRQTLVLVAALLVVLSSMSYALLLRRILRGEGSR